MKHPKPELISAYVDGELRGMQHGQVKQHLSQCPLCAAEYRHIGHVQRMLRDNLMPVRMDDPPEFFWHKVKSEIEARGRQPEVVDVPSLPWGDWVYLHQKRLMAFASAAAIVVVTLTALWMTYRIRTNGQDGVSIVASVPTSVDQVGTQVRNTVASVLDPVAPQQSGVSVIWVSGLPWTKDMMELQTITANPYYYLDM